MNINENIKKAGFENYNVELFINELAIKRLYENGESDIILHFIRVSKFKTDEELNKHILDRISEDAELVKRIKSLI